MKPPHAEKLPASAANFHGKQSNGTWPGCPTQTMSWVCLLGIGRALSHAQTLKAAGLFISTRKLGQNTAGQPSAAARRKLHTFLDTQLSRRTSQSPLSQASYSVRRLTRQWQQRPQPGVQKQPRKLPRRLRGRLLNRLAAGLKLPGRRQKLVEGACLTSFRAPGFGALL